MTLGKKKSHPSFPGDVGNLKQPNFLRLETGVRECLHASITLSSDEEEAMQKGSVPRPSRRNKHLSHSAITLPGSITVCFPKAASDVQGFPLNGAMLYGSSLLLVQNV